MPQKVSATNTKAQILKAYEELLKEVESRKADNPKVIHQEKEEKKKVASATAKTEEGIVKSIADLKLKIGETLDTIAKNLLSEKEQLREIQEAIAIEKKNLEDLYGISANADTLAALLLAQEEKKKSFEEEMASRKKEFEEKMAQEKAAFEAEMKNQKAVWEQEKKEMAQKAERRKRGTTETAYPRRGRISIQPETNSQKRAGCLYFEKRATGTRTERKTDGFRKGNLGKGKSCCRGGK